MDSLSFIRKTLPASCLLTGFLCFLEFSPVPATIEMARSGGPRIDMLTEVKSYEYDPHL